MSSKKPLVRYFYNGEWKDATVKDIGDLEKLTTSVKTDLVSAINSISSGTGMTEEMKEAVEELQNNVNNLESNINDIKTGGLNPTQKSELEKEMAKKAEEINAQIDVINSETNSKIEQIKIEYNLKMEAIDKELLSANESLDGTKSELAKVKKDLSNTDLNILNVTQSVDEVKGELSQKVDQTVFDLTEAEVERQKTAIEQNAEGIKLSATKEELSLANDRVSKAEAKLEIHEDKINSKVTHEEVREEIDKIEKYQPNLLRNTRDWIDWINPDSTKLKIKSDTYRMCHILEVSGNDIGLFQSVNDLEVGKTYTLTVWAKANSGSELWLDNGVLVQMAQFDGDKNLSDTWKRYKANIIADKETMNIKFIFKKLVGVGSLSGSKMELGANASGWQPHADDVYERTVKNETQIQQNSDSIISTVETLEAQGDTLKQHKTRIDQQDNSIKLQVEALEKVGEETKKNSSSIDVMEKEITSKVSSTEVGEMIADVNIDNRNRILNSDFARTTEKWTVAKDFKLKEVNGTQMLHASRTGLKEDMSITAVSNSFPLTQGQRVMFGFDFMADKDKIPDKDVVAILEVLDAKDVRIDFKEISISGKYTNDGTIQRINDNHTTKLANAAKARLVFVLRRNGSVHFGRGMAQLGDIKSTDWSIAPEDTEIRRVQMESEIKQTQEQIKLTVSKADMDELTEKVNTNTSKIDMTDKKIDLRVTETKQYTDDKTKAAETASKTYSDAQLKIETDKISQTVTSVKQTADQAKKDATDKAKETREWAQSQINQTSKEITSKVEAVNTKVDSLEIGSRNLLVGTPTLTENKIGDIESFKYRDNSVLSTSIPLKDYVDMYSPKTSIEATGKIYTLSFYAKSDEDGLDTRCYFYSPNTTVKSINSQGYQGSAVDGASFFKLSKEWVRYWVTWEQTSTTEKKNVIVNRVFGKASAKGKVYLSSPILVEGSKPSDWSPAPEDQSKEVSDLKSWTSSEIKQTSDSWGVQIEDVKLNSEALKSGKLLSTDPLFQEGFNGLKIYNNSANGNVTYSIIENDKNPTGSPKVLEVVTKGVASPNHGGVTWQNMSRSGAKYVYKLIAKIPKGRNIEWAANAFGNGFKIRWLTSTAGTDKWEEYICLAECGIEGTFSSIGFFYLKNGAIPTATAPLKWEICYASVTDITTFDNTLYDLKRDVEFKVTPKEIYGMVASSEEYQEEMGKLTTNDDLEEATKGIAKMETDLKEVGQRVGKFEQTADDFTVSLGKLNGRVDENNKKLMDVDHFMTFERDSAKPKEAYMKIGSKSDSMEVQIGRGKISFIDSGEEVAYFSNQQLYVAKGVMTDTFQIGSHTFENAGNGSTVLTFTSDQK